MRYDDVMWGRPVYRWKSFWLGLCVLAFLSWAWVRSMTWMDSVGWQKFDTSDFSKTRGILAWHASGEVLFAWEIYDPFGEDGMSYGSETLEAIAGRWVKDPFGGVYAEEVDPDGGRSLMPVVVEEGRVTVAYWFLVLVFFLAWSGWLVWRWGRRRVC